MTTGSRRNYSCILACSLRFMVSCLIMVFVLNTSNISALYLHGRANDGLYTITLSRSFPVHLIGTSQFMSSKVVEVPVESSSFEKIHVGNFWKYISTTPTDVLLHKGSFLFMGKGDGKKKRKRKSSPASSVPADGQHSSSNGDDNNNNGNDAPRVSKDINIPVRHQIRMAQLNKQYQKQRANPGFRQKKVVRTKYRRQWDEEEIEQKREERRKRGQDPNWEVVLNQTKASPLVIVDGYNIIHQWPRLKKHMAKGDSQRARQLLIDDLENLRSLKGWRIEVVFDGTRRSLVGHLGHGVTGSRIKATRADQANKASVTKQGVRVIFTGNGVEADSYIESRCGQAKEVTDGIVSGSFIVATDDAMIKLAGQNAGALCMGAPRFVEELKAMKKAIDYRVEAAVAKANGHPIRPEKLRGTYFHKFGRGSVLIEDKRQRKAKNKEEEDKYDFDIDVEVEEDENGIPWWAKVPNQTRRYG